RLVILLGRFVVLIAKAAKEGIRAFATAAEKAELRLLLGHAHEANEIHLVVFIDRAAQEFEFPVGAAADIQHAIRPAATIDGGQAAVVGQCRFGRAAGG